VLFSFYTSQQRFNSRLFRVLKRSRAEQSRAEQSRAEQSRAEQSRAEHKNSKGAEQSRAEHKNHCSGLIVDHAAIPAATVFTLLFLCSFLDP
jgi:hypothetical protein